MYQAVTFSFKVLQNFIVYESADDRNLRAFFNRVKKKSLSCNIFTKYYIIVTGMPYLFAKDERVSLNRLSSRALKMVKFKGFRPATIWRGAAFHFLPVFSKKKTLWKL